MYAKIRRFRIGLAVVTLGAALAALSPTSSAAAHGAQRSTMPDVRGQGLNKAYQALGFSTAITVEDGRGQARRAIYPAGWKVCEQSPPPGAALADRSITLTAVREGEACP